jgi:hypothetical protein
MKFLALSFCFFATVSAQDGLPQPKLPPQVQAIPEPYSQVSFQNDAREVIRYHFGPDLRRPFLYPVIGPSGRSVTRMGHPHDPESHSHHNSIWISHHDVGGLSFWDDHSKGKIVHQRVEEFLDGPDSATLFTVNHWINETNNQVLLVESRTTHYRSLPNQESFLEIDLELSPRGDLITLGKTPFGLVGVRMAKTIGVNDGGGVIRNSEGARNEKEIFWKHARWVDYSGPMVGRNEEGITLLDHPSNPRHPVGFHVRADGWMGASLTLDEPLTIQKGTPLKLRYGFYVHAGRRNLETLDAQWKKFAGSKIILKSPKK